MPQGFSGLFVLLLTLLPHASLAGCNQEYHFQIQAPEVAHPRTLTEQPTFPKLEIGQYVQSKGFLVPKRFATLAAALASGRPFIARSEYWREYFEAAGLFESYVYDPADASAADWAKALSVFRETGDEKKAWAELHQVGLLPERIRYYSELSGIPEKDILDQAGFSYWELLGGDNFSMIADSAVEGRYHLVTGSRSLVIEDGQVVFDSMINEVGAEAAEADRKANSAYSDIPGLVEYYDRIRNLPQFDPTHCPVIEFQAVGDKRYFLQYHRSRNFKPASFRLDRALEPGEVQALYVRGITPREGIEVEVEFRIVEDLGVKDLEQIEAAYFRFNGYESANPVFGEMVTRRLKVWFENPKGGSTGMRLNGHLSVSTAFNPELFIGLNRDAIFPENPLMQARQNPGRKISRKVRIISDGRKAYLKPL